MCKMRQKTHLDIESSQLQKVVTMRISSSQARLCLVNASVTAVVGRSSGWEGDVMASQQLNGLAWHTEKPQSLFNPGTVILRTPAC